MEQRATSSADEIDLHELFFKLRNRWPLFVGGLLLTATVAFLYLQVKAPVYDFRASMLLGNQSSGSKQAQELLQMLEVKEKGVKMEDEIGLLRSADVVRRAITRLPFAVSYYAVPGSWLNSVKDVQVRERAAGEVPFRVIPAPKMPQLTGTRISVEPLPDGRFRVQAQAKRGQLFHLSTGEMAREVLDVTLDQTVAAGDTLRSPLLTAVIKPEPGYPATGTNERYFFTFNDLGSLTGSYQGNLAVRPIEHESRIVELTLKDVVPAKATQFLDTLMAVYIEDDLREKNITGYKTVDFLDHEIAKLSDSLRHSAAALSSFRSARGVVDVGAQSSEGIRQLSDLGMMRARAATNRKYYQNMLSYLRANQGATQMVSPSSVGIEDPVVNNLILQLTDLNSQRAALGVNASSNNPLVTVLDERIRTAKQSLMQTLTNMTRATDITLRDLDQQLGRVRGSINAMPENERQLASLKNKSDFNDKNYNFLVEKRSEAAISLATNATDKKVIDRAKMSSGVPSAPKPGLVMLLAVLAGLGVPLGLTLLLDKANRRIQSKEDLARITGIPLLGVVAHGTSADKEQMLRAPKGPIAESFRSIRVNLQYLSAGLDKKVIGVTSSVPGEGKTFCAVNLAAEIAQSGRRVLLLECDLRRPTVAGYFGLDSCATHGLSTYLTGESTLAECVHDSGVPNLQVMCCGPVPPNPTELLETERMENLLAQLRADYDYVLVDTPPVGYVAEFFVLLRYLEANIYVVRQNYTDKGLISQINELHQEQKIKQIYMIINDMHFTKTYEYRYKEKAYAYGY
ncbi:capsular exopolysaccharide family [Hymenobacter daecheongensis DSM 21074]|uniref:non-specific protein-tyrosine kinase n=1 Tax=Hymenobacter daecheongensis DSM 21074 TaxID=1121955 RepID=A0A1M6KIX3_9BACT|nr:polysaccharide biosynthesis tyrosine autokinase [Hymenobacter daecheongensis]SHJ58897.1 capsular exopolysaccharide family [Hymenobacter daecheongensis DSM 21074]